MIGQSQWNGKTFYVESLPGQGGVDWGWTTIPSRAIELSPHWQKRFLAARRAVGSIAQITDVPGIVQRKSNPRPRIGTQKAKRASSATGRAPTKRLIARRRANAKPGYFPNPLKMTPVLQSHLNKLNEPKFRARWNTPHGILDTIPMSKADAQDWAERKGGIVVPVKKSRKRNPNARQRLKATQAAIHAKYPFAVEVRGPGNGKWYYMARYQTRIEAETKARFLADVSHRQVRVMGP